MSEHKDSQDDGGDGGATSSHAALLKFASSSAKARLFWTRVFVSYGSLPIFVDMQAGTLPEEVTLSEELEGWVKDMRQDIEIIEMKNH